MFVIAVILFVVLCAVFVGTGVLLLLTVRAARKRRLLADAHGTSCDALDCIGISALCSGISDLKQVENLLAVEYARYEVVLALDAERYPEDFAALIARYHMINVNFVSSGEFPDKGVRAMLRSRKRCFRRLVLIDRAYDGASGDFNAAAGVATYNYVLPLKGACLLLPNAVERLVVEVSERPAGTVELVCAPAGCPAMLFNREAAAVAGGFGMRPERRIDPRRVRTLCEPLLEHSADRGARYHLRIASAVCVLTLAVCAVLWLGWWTAAAVLLTALFVWFAGLYAAPMLLGPSVLGYSGFILCRCCLRKMHVRNFTIS